MRARTLSRSLPQVMYRVRRSGPPKAQLGMRSSGTSMKSRSFPRGEMTWMPGRGSGGSPQVPRGGSPGGAGIERLARVPAAVQPGGDVEVPLDVDRHAVAAPAGGEVVDQPLVADAAVGPQGVGADPARPPRALVGVDQVEGRIVGGDRD